MNLNGGVVLGDYVVGQKVNGTVIGLQKYGVFISLDKNTQGLVHISEITNGYVKDVTDFVSIGDVVKVKIISINDHDGKIALSLKDEKNLVKKSGRYGPNGRLLPEETKSGFSTLRDKLDDWIEQGKKW